VIISKNILTPDPCRQASCKSVPETAQVRSLKHEDQGTRRVSMLKISLVLITLNAGRYLRRILSSVSFASEIIVVDSGSTDSTLQICRESGARIFKKAWTSYARQKNYAIEQAESPWILSLDADEVLSPELAGEISKLQESAPYAGYKIPRLNHYFGRALRHGGQYPDFQLRLFRKDRGRFNDRPIHESVIVSGAIGQLRGEMLHYSYGTIDEYFSKFNRYTELEAQRLAGQEGRPGAVSIAAALLVKPWLKFIRRYFFKLGFLDGVPGLLAALFNSFTMIASYARYWEKTRQDSSGPQ